MLYMAKNPCYQLIQGNTMLYSETQYPLTVTVKDLSHPYQSYYKELLLCQVLPVWICSCLQAKTSVRLSCFSFALWVWKHLTKSLKVWPVSPRPISNCLSMVNMSKHTQSIECECLMYLVRDYPLWLYYCLYLKSSSSRDSLLVYCTSA